MPTMKENLRRDTSNFDDILLLAFFALFVVTVVVL